MLVTKPAVATDAGISLQLRNMRGEQLEFTKLEVGSGQYGQDEATEEALRKRTTLKAKKQQFGISSIDVSSDKTTLILSSMITNTDLKEGYTIRELGLYARIKDQPDTECLVSVSLAEIEDEIPPYNSDPESRILMKYQFAVSDSDTVSLSYEHDPVALVEDVDAKVARLLEKTKTLQSELENVKKELLGVVKQTAIVNNNTTTEAGFALDARQANPTIEGTLAANILQLNNDSSVRIEGVLNFTSEYVGQNLYSFAVKCKKIIQINSEFFLKGLKAGNTYVIGFIAQYPPASTFNTTIVGINTVSSQPIILLSSITEGNGAVYIYVPIDLNEVCQFRLCYTYLIK